MIEDKLIAFGCVVFSLFIALLMWWPVIERVMQ